MKEINIGLIIFLLNGLNFVFFFFFIRNELEVVARVGGVLVFLQERLVLCKVGPNWLCIACPSLLKSNV